MLKSLIIDLLRLFGRLFTVTSVACLDDLGVTRAAHVCDGDFVMIFDRTQFTAEAKNQYKINFAADFLFGMGGVVKEVTAGILFV